jgi:hypothetical protein
VADHPVTRNLTWADVGSPAVATIDPPAGWTQVVTAGGKVWVAVREQPIKAVWVAFETADWARSSEYVVFWANVFNWLGAGGERFAAHPVGTLEGDWTPVELSPSVAPPEPKLWPGLYRRADGTLRALMPPELSEAAASPQTDWHERLRRALADAPEGGLELAPALALAALVCLGGAALLWKRSNGPTRANPSQPGAA